MLLVSLSFPCFSLLYVYTEVNSQLIPENHKLSCSYNETQTLACLNGGSCFAVYVEDRVVQCACNRKYIGRRCEMIDPEIIFDDSEKAMIHEKLHQDKCGSANELNRIDYSRCMNKTECEIYANETATHQQLISQQSICQSIDCLKNRTKEVAIGLISGFAALIFLFIVFLIVGCVWFVKRSACTGICNTA